MLLPRGRATLSVFPFDRHAVHRQEAPAVGLRSATECSLAHNVADRDEVDRVMRQARQAGAVEVKPAADTFWGGYAGYFQDPDGHLWEVAWNPQLLPRD